MSRADGDPLRALLAPMSRANLLVPGSLVAEVLSFVPPSPTDGPKWLLGYITWREQSLPCIDLECLASGTPTVGGSRRRLMVLKLVDTPRDDGFVVILLQGSPRLTRVHAENLEPDPDGLVAMGIAASMLVDGGRALIPDFAAIAALLDEPGTT